MVRSHLGGIIFLMKIDGEISLRWDDFSPCKVFAGLSQLPHIKSVTNPPPSLEMLFASI